MNCQLIIPAAGHGMRLGAVGPKALVELASKPLLVNTLERCLPAFPDVQTVIVAPREHMNQFQDTLASFFPTTAFRLVQGGAERQQSVENGLEAIDADTAIVAVHDAARPFVPLRAIREALAAAQEFGAATVAVPCVDTILEAEDSQFLSSTPDRAHLWACQTPQCFRTEILRDAHALARREGFTATDDATLVRRAGGRVKLVEGSAYNFKLTTPADFAAARAFMREGLV